MFYSVWKKVLYGRRGGVDGRNNDSYFVTHALWEFQTLHATSHPSVRKMARNHVWVIQYSFSFRCMIVYPSELVFRLLDSQTRRYLKVRDCMLELFFFFSLIYGLFISTRAKKTPMTCDWTATALWTLSLLGVTRKEEVREHWIWNPEGMEASSNPPSISGYPIFLS